MNKGICAAGRTVVQNDDGFGVEDWGAPCDNVAVFTISTLGGALEKTVCTRHRDLLLAAGMSPTFVRQLECAVGREISSTHDTRTASVDWSTPCLQEPVEAVQFRDGLVVVFCRRHFDSLRDLMPEGAITARHDRTW